MVYIPILIPLMIKRGYDKMMAAGVALIATSGGFLGAITTREQLDSPSDCGSAYVFGGGIPLPRAFLHYSGRCFISAPLCKEIGEKSRNSGGRSRRVSEAQ
nr:hypothetical protein [Sinobaca sp. H24]